MSKISIVDLNLIKNLRLRFGNTGKKGQGGEGGQIIIITEKIKGGGTISAEGGIVGGKGGRVHIEAKQSSWKGKVSTRGGKGCE